MEFALSQAVASGDAFEHRPSEGGGGIDLRALTHEHPQTHAAGGEVLHGVDQMGEVTAETVAFQTTSTSPFLRARKQLLSPGRSSRTPEAKSW